MTNHRRHHGRRAALLISVLVCLTVVMVLFTRWVKLASLERQQLRDQQNRLQAEYLAESGLERAIAQLAMDATYAGETWRIDKESLRGRDGATVAIQVESLPDGSSGRLVRAVADYPAEGRYRARRSRETRVTLPKPGEAP